MPVKLCGCGGQHYRCADGFLRCKVCGERADTDDMAMPMQRCVCKEPDKEINSLGGIYLWHCKKCKKGGELAKHVVNFPNANATAPLGISLYDLGKGETMVLDKEQGCVRGRKDATPTHEDLTKLLKEQGVKSSNKTKQEEVFTEVKDSGQRQEFATGAVRDVQTNKGMPHLLPTHALLRLAQHFENGAKKYGKNNWRKGIPLSRYLDSCFRHWCAVRDCLRDEDHAASVLWNIACFIETAHMINTGKLPKELDDIGWFENVERSEANNNT
jgi:hypothetical protein